MSLYKVEICGVNTAKLPLLNNEEKEELFKRIKQGDKEAREQYIKGNLRLVLSVIQRFSGSNENVDDLFQIGCIGLIKAIDTFDAGKGRLATYACRCIDNELLMLLRSKKKTSREVSLYEPIGQDKEGNEIHLMDVIEQEQQDVVEALEYRGNVQRLMTLMRQELTEREREILLLRYGLWGNRELTQSEIGERLGISRSYVSRIEKKALGKLRGKFEQG